MYMIYRHSFCCLQLVVEFRCAVQDVLVSVLFLFCAWRGSGCTTVFVPSAVAVSLGVKLSVLPSILLLTQHLHAHSTPLTCTTVSSLRCSFISLAIVGR